MKALLRLRYRQVVNRLKGIGLRHYLIFSLFGVGMLLLLGFFFIKIFGYLYRQPEFPLFFKLFLAEKILLMVFLTLFSMLVMSALISTLNIFFLSKDLHLLFSSPMGVGKIFLWKGVEVGLNSSIMVIFFSLPVIFSYAYYFAPSLPAVLGIWFFFLLYSVSGVLLGILLGLIIPAFFSVRRLQPILSLVSILIISLIVIFLRLLKPEEFGNPIVIDNLLEYMAGFEVKIFAYFPFAWLAKAFSLIGSGKFHDLWGIFIAFAGLILVLSAVAWFVQKKYYFYLFDRLNRNSSSRFRSTWKTGKQANAYRTLYQKEVKTFIRTPAQWSQLLIIAAIIVVFILNMKSIPMPHPSFKNLIVYLNLGMAAFIVAGLNSRFTFTTIPMERPGLVHIFASPFDREKLLRFKLIFFMIPQVILGFILFFTADLTLHLEPFARLSGILFLLPILPFLTLLALFYSLRIEESAPLTPQHLLVTRSGISYMLWSMAAIAASMIYFVRPLFLYYYNQYRHVPVPFLEICAWFSGFFLFFVIAMVFLFKRSLHLWREHLIQ